MKHRPEIFPTRVLLVAVPLLLPGLAARADAPPDPATLPAPPEPLRAGFRAIEEADLRAWVEFLASPELEGRETPSRGYDVAARFCASLYARFGLEPAGDRGTYFQDFEIVRSEAQVEASTFEVKDAEGVDRFPLSELALGGRMEIDWSVPWVFVGHGEGPESDAPDSFRGLDLSGKAALVLPRPGGNRAQAARGAIRAGATRVAVISDGRVRSRSGLSVYERPRFLLEESPPSRAEVVFISRKAASRILRSRGHTVEKLLEAGDAMPRFDLAGVEVTVTVKRKTTTAAGRNVVGLLRGSDPALRDQAVVLGAHLDHVGVQQGKIYFGADDDASGSAGVLAVAEAFAESPRRPAQSVLFVLFGGEEKGLWGSRWFVRQPPVPLSRLTAMLQMDMIGRNEELASKKEPAGDNTNTVHLVGSDRASRDLHRSVLAQNRYLGLEFEYDQEDVFDRSDHWSFAEKGVPVGFFFTGFHPDYHQPTDTPEKVNYAKMARILRLIFATTWDLADRPGPLNRQQRL